MQTIRDLSELRAWRASVEGTVALVPTMGALHDGHMALVAEARARADNVVASIFVNPMQFAPTEDLSRYPRREATDAALLKDAGVKVLWAPDVATMYPAGFATTVSVAGLGDGLDGASRPGHFDGVATVVAKLFNQVRPDITVFGEKDWQQLAIVRRMTEDLDLGVEIIGMPTQRDADGLALSSRNIYLSEDERRDARMLPRALGEAASAIGDGGDTAEALLRARATLEKAGFVVDYVELVGPDLLPTNESLEGGRLLAAAKVGTTRLIDNLALPSK
ncbi:MAG: pantoate--beta-alanine ligase [Sphingomonadales bacterium]